MAMVSAGYGPRGRERSRRFPRYFKHIFLNPISNFKGVTLHLSEAVPTLKINSVLRRDPDP